MVEVLCLLPRLTEGWPNPLIVSFLCNRQGKFIIKYQEIKINDNM